MKVKIFARVLLLCCIIKLSVSRPATTNGANITGGISPDSTERAANLRQTQQSGEDLYTKASFSNGMDPTIVAEVLKTGKPIVKTETDSNGTKRTTTYTVDSDGTVSRHTLTEYASTVVQPTRINMPLHRNTELWPDLSSSPKKVDTDWEWNPSTLPQNVVSSRHPDTFPQWTTSWRSPVFTPNVPEGNENSVKLPTTWNTKYWPNFEPSTIDYSGAGTETKTFIDRNGTKVTTTHTVGPTKWYTRTFTYPSTNVWTEKETPSTVAKTPNILHPTNKDQLPSLTDFLESQYGTPRSNGFQPVKTTTATPIHNTNRHATTAKPVTTISIDDLPIVKIFNRSDPIYEDTFEIPMNGANGPIKTFKIENVPQNHFPELRTPATTLKTRTQESDFPALIGRDRNIEPLIQTAPSASVLPNYFNHFEEDVPRGPFVIKSASTTPTTQYSASHSGAQFPIYRPSNTNVHRLPNLNTNSDTASVAPDTGIDYPKTAQALNPIDEFLKKFNITTATIAASNGELIRRIVDDEGRVLTATFLLSSVRNEEEQNKKDTPKNPIK